MVIIVAFGLGLASCGLWKGRTGGNIVISGNIELTQVDIAFKIPGKLIELPIDEGAPVAKGTILARLDTVQTERQRDRDQAALRSAETMLVQQRTAIEYQRASLEADLAVRQAAVKQAEARLQEFLSGSRKQEIEEARAAAQAAGTEHVLAQSDWERAQSLYKTDDISTAQRDQYKARFDSSAAALRQAEERLALVTEGPRTEQIDAARAQLDQARASVKVSDASRLELKRKEQELQTRTADIARARAQVGVTDAQLDDAIVTAPVNGVVLVKSAEAGEVLGAGSTVATIGEMDHPWMRGYIAESDLGRVKLGARARVTTDSFPGKVYWGRVSFISSEAEFTPKQIQTQEERVKLVYRIKIEIENPQHELKLNMPADAEIVVDGTPEKQTAEHAEKN
jgi:HlyD family secretion protein